MASKGFGGSRNADKAHSGRNKQGLTLVSNGGDAEITDDVYDYHLPKSVRDNISSYEKVDTFNKLKDALREHGIELTTDNVKLSTTSSDVPNSKVRDFSVQILSAIQTYKDSFGQDSLKKLKRINLVDKDLPNWAAYHYNERGEHDPLAGTLRFRQLTNNGREIFHELAHAMQDSKASKGESATEYAYRVSKELGISESFHNHVGVTSQVSEAERFADALGYGFSQGHKGGVDFIQSYYSFVKKRK